MSRDSGAFEPEATQPGAEAPAASEAPATDPGAGTPKVLVVAVVTALVALAAGLLWTWWHDDPQAPLSRLGLERGQQADGSADADADGAGDAEGADGADDADGQVDAEQQAFLERQRRRARELAETSEGLEPSESISFTDRSLIRSLAGRWRLDLGGRWVVAEFAPVVVERVRRGSLLVELYPVQSRGLPPFYTVFELPDQGAYIAFRAADGSYRLVLERVVFHDLDLFSFQLGRGGERRNAYRLGGARLPPADGPMSRDDRRPETRRSPPVAITVEPPPPIDELWRQAQTLRSAGRLHSLKRHLQRILIAHPSHRQARRWERRIDGWIADQQQDLIDDLQDALEDLADGVRDRDLDDILDTWGGRPDAGTRRFFTDLLARHRQLDARITLLTVRVEDGVADFSATTTFEGWSGRARDREIVPLRWRGQFRDDRFVTPFGP